MELLAVNGSSWCASSTLPLCCLCVVVAVLLLSCRRRPVYLVDFACYKPPDECKCSKERFLQQSVLSGGFDDDSLDFQRRILERSGMGDETYVPSSLLGQRINRNLASARCETEEVMFGAVAELLQRTGVAAQQIGILVVNCSLFNPAPSLASALVNRFRMPDDVDSFSLAGMGCSAGVIAVELAAKLLRVNAGQRRRWRRPRCAYALVVSTENVTLSWYLGNRRSMLLTNCLFRMGGAAVLLSADRTAARYQLLHTVRTHRGADDASFRCVYQQQDDEDGDARQQGGDGRQQGGDGRQQGGDGRQRGGDGRQQGGNGRQRGGNVGVALSKELKVLAGGALAANMAAVAPLVLPWREQAAYVAASVAARLRGTWRRGAYVPDFKRAFEHFCVHPGGVAVLDEVQKRLRLSDGDMEASRMTLERWGNTSSSSIWYELAYLEAQQGRIKRGDRVWQIAFGSGFKCNSVVWRALKNGDAAATNVWGTQ